MLPSFNNFLESYISKSNIQKLLKQYEYGDELEEYEFVFGKEMVGGSLDNLVKNINKAGMTLDQIEAKLKNALN